MLCGRAGPRAGLPWAGCSRLYEQFSKEVKTDRVTDPGHLVILRQPCPGVPLDPKLLACQVCLSYLLFEANYSYCSVVKWFRGCPALPRALWAAQAPSLDSAMPGMRTGSVFHV